MDSNKIEALLARYWECETSLEEENELREYFSQPDIPLQFREAAALFTYFGEQRNKQVKDPTFERTVVEVIQTTTPKKSMVVRMLYNVSKIAAGLIVVVVATYYIRSEIRKTTPQEMVDTYSDPKLAFEETKKALMMISKSFGHVEEEAKKINLLNEAKEEIQKEKDTQEL
jgi:hypothetical protein